MRKVRLSVACGDYDRTRPLLDGLVVPEGIAPTYLSMPVEEIFFRMTRFQEFDVAEMSLSTYVASLDSSDPPFVAIPIFLSRMFRHSAVYVRSGVTRAEQLAGGVVGVPEFQLTACVWVRGILEEHHGLPADAVSYVTGGLESPGRVEKTTIDVPFTVMPVPSGRTLSSMLAEGTIDAIYSPRVTSVFLAGDPRVARLFGNSASAERAYFAKTRIFPIMHVVVIRREVYERHRWIAQALVKAFTAAKALAYERLRDSSSLRFMSPWLIQHAESERALMGEDYWSYGVEGNEDALATFLRYHHRQGLSSRLFAPDDLFAPETAESFVI